MPPTTLWLLVAVGILAGCASTGELRSITPVASRLSTYRAPVVDVSSAVPEASQETTQLETMAVTQLRSRGVYEKVMAGSAAGDAAADLRLRARITELNRVGTGSRLLLGALAGRAKVVVAAELVDARSGQRVGSFTAEGQSSGGTAFAGTTEQAIERAVEQIVEFVVRHR
jgi:uncharacterized lipoprotein YajG